MSSHLITGSIMTFASSYLSFCLFIFLITESEARVGPKNRIGEATSMTYFESGPSPSQHKSPIYSSDNQWTLLHPLRINHNSNAFSERRPFVAPIKPRAKLVSTSISAPAGYNKEYFSNIVEDTPIRSPYKPAKPYFKPAPVARPVTFVHQYPKAISRSFEPLAPAQPGFNVRQLVDQFQLVSMKPLLNPAIVRQLPAQPSASQIESRLLLSPFTFYKANQMFVPINNQPVPIKAMASAIQLARQGDVLVNSQPVPLDSELIGIINRSSRKYGFQKAAKMHQISANDIYGPSDLLNDLAITRMNFKPLNDQVGVNYIAPDFKRMTKSKRIRTATLGAIGYQS